MTDAKEAFYRSNTGEEISADKVRFAIGDRETGIRSAVWKAMASPSRSSDDMFMETDGLSKDIKVTFHKQDALVAYRSERFSKLKAENIIPMDSPRATESVPILSEPFVVSRIAFFPFILKPEKLWKQPPSKLKITLIEPPPQGHFTKVFVVHSYNEPVHLHDEESDRHYPWFARIRSGNRHLTFIHVLAECDEAAERTRIRQYLSSVPARPELVDLAKNRELSAIFWGKDDTYLNFFEVHNIAPSESAQT